MAGAMVCLHKNAIVISTRKHCEVTNIYKLFCHRKCTVAAAYNSSVHVLQRIMFHRKYMGISHNYIKLSTCYIELTSLLLHKNNYMIVKITTHCFHRPSLIR